MRVDISRLRTLDDYTHRYIERVIAAVNGNYKEASRVLGISRSTLYRRYPREVEDSFATGERNDS